MSVYVNGRIAPSNTPVVCAEDQGFLLGLSVFETVLVEDGHVHFLGEHLDRLRNGALKLDIPWPPPWGIEGAILELIAAEGARRCAARVTYSRGVAGRPTLVVTVRSLEPLPDEGVRISVASYRTLADDPLGGLKSSNRLRYVLAREEARERGAWEALLLNHEGDVAEGSVSNVFAVNGGELVTPSLDRGGLGGIVRGVILTELERDPPVVAGGGRMRVSEGRLELERIASAEEIFLTNTTGGVIPVRELLGMGDRRLEFLGASGPVTRQAANRLAAAEKRDRGAGGNPESGCG
jgi:branched-chain amino acid aminotransferase